MTEFMLDSDIAVYVMTRRYSSTDARFIAAAGHLSISSIVYSELRYGAEKSQRRDRSLEALAAFVTQVQILPFGSDAAHHYGEIRAALERLGTPIGGNDLLIAGHARALGVTLVTNNRREFDRVPGLSVENWLANP
jgi:tRNA(fMet)-specific endonuclease VapC